MTQKTEQLKLNFVLLGRKALKLEFSYSSYLMISKIRFQQV